jgi:hypothetical protein
MEYNTKVKWLYQNALHEKFQVNNFNLQVPVPLLKTCLKTLCKHTFVFVMLNAVNDSVLLWGMMCTDSVWCYIFTNLILMVIMIHIF